MTHLIEDLNDMFYINDDRNHLQDGDSIEVMYGDREEWVKVTVAYNDKSGEWFAVFSDGTRELLEDGWAARRPKPTYTRPELTDEDKKKAEQKAKALFRQYGIAKVTYMLAALCIENIRLVKEINEHREARGIELLETHEV